MTSTASVSTACKKAFLNSPDCKALNYKLWAPNNSRVIEQGSYEVSLISRPTLFFALWFALTMIHKSGSVLFSMQTEKKKKLGTRLVRGPQSGGMRTNGLNWNGLTSCHIVILFLTGE